MHSSGNQSTYAADVGGVVGWDDPLSMDHVPRAMSLDQYYQEAQAAVQSMHQRVFDLANSMGLSVSHVSFSLQFAKCRCLDGQIRLRTFGVLTLDAEWINAREYVPLSVVYEHGPPEEIAAMARMSVAPQCDFEWTRSPQSIVSELDGLVFKLVDRSEDHHKNERELRRLQQREAYERQRAAAASTTIHPPGRWEI